MCFSADASLITGAVLVPAGIYCIASSIRKNSRYILVAGAPLFFGIQQLFEAGVWHGLENDHPALVQTMSISFLFFAIAFWPWYVPLGAAILEPHSGKRRLFLLMAAVGFVLGMSEYIPAVLHYGSWLHVRIAGHSIRYDFSEMPRLHSVEMLAAQLIYIVVTCVPLPLSKDRHLRLLGISIAVSAVIAHFVFWYAFISVWCFFAALLSIQIAYVLYRVPPRGQSAPSTAPVGDSKQAKFAT